MRIYKGSEITLRLYNPCKIEDGLVDVILYTTNPKLAYKIKDATVEGNIVYVKIDKFTFNNMEDGVINYIILDEVYNTERQSSYYLKTPDDYIAKSVQSSKNIDISINGDYKILPDEDYTSIEEVNVHVEFDAEHYYQEGYETGKAYQKSKLESVSITENGTYSREDGYNEVVVEVPDLNGDYNEGYDVGKVDGYDSGYTAGETEQKSKLTNITITENGTYTREDGYNSVVVDITDTNGSYDEGYQAGIDYASENAEEIAAANAIDLVATEFGTYYTKYSDNIDNVYPELITGVFPNGKNFYNYSTGKYYYNTGLQTSTTTKIEIWFYNDGVNTVESYYFKTTQGENYNFALKNKQYNEGYRASIGDNNIDFTLEVGWQHLAMSFANGLVVNGEKIGDFNGNIIGTSNIEIGENVLTYTPTHTIGMIKIDGYVIIPTADGFLNTTTNQLLEKMGDGVTYKYIDNTPIVLDNLIKSVDVQPKIDVEKYGVKLSQSKFTEIPDIFDFSNVVDMSNMFYSCSNLQTIPLMDTSKVTNMNGTFAYCLSLQAISLIDTSNVTNMGGMFQNCKILQTIPSINTSNVTNMNTMFQDCTNLINVPPLNAEKLDMPNSYQGLFMYNEYPKLTDFGGLIGLKYSLTGDYTFPRLPNLTYQSCINILNGLYDFVSNGETPTSKQGQLKVHPNFLTTVGDEISIGTAKGWLITA